LYLYGSWQGAEYLHGGFDGDFVWASDISIEGPQWLRTFEGVEPMGRGRAKAKQVKVARQLKYNSGGTDLDRLRAELGVASDSRNGDHDSGRDEYSGDDDVADDEDEEEDDPDDMWGHRPAR
jgi:hypothetical protein